MELPKQTGVHRKIADRCSDFETVTVTCLDGRIEGMLDEEVERTALLDICHPSPATRS